MKLTGSDGRTYTAHFNQIPQRRGHRRGRLYRGYTACFIHAGECVRRANTAGCYADEGALGQSFCSDKDVFTKRDGHLRSFRRAVDALFPRRFENRDVRASLWQDYTRQVAQKSGHSLRGQVEEFLSAVKKAPTTSDPYFHQWVIDELSKVLGIAKREAAQTANTSK
jgi:hypothetical protein